MVASIGGKHGPAIRRSLGNRGRLTQPKPSFNAAPKPPRDKIVAELALGFWSSLFNVHFQALLWKDLRLVFPRCPKLLRKRHTVSSALNLVRDLRNRVFHHEQLLWLTPSLIDLHAKGIEVLGWLDPQLPPWLSQYDRLPATWAAAQPI